MTKMIVETARFGQVEIAENAILHFPEPILGFNHSHRYIILDHAADSPFKWLQSADEPALAFVITDPKLFGIPYEFDIPQEFSEQLKLKGIEEAAIFTIVNIPPDDPARMSTNLLGPIVINRELRQAMQLVLIDTHYDIKTRLIPDEALKKQPDLQNAPSDKGS